MLVAHQYNCTSGENDSTNM